MVARPTALTIAGTDSSNGAGATADLATFDAHGAYGMAAVVGVTAQNTVGVQAVETVSPYLVEAQIASVASDVGVDATKTGMLADADHVAAVADALARYDCGPLVVDPVAVSKHGVALLADDAVETMLERLIPLARIVTPNLPEAARLAGLDLADVESPGGMERAGRAIAARGPAVLVKGGHRPDGDVGDLLIDGDRTVWLAGEHQAQRHTHGTGCTLSAAIAARLAHGDDLERAVRLAKEHVTGAIRWGAEVGAGIGPVNPRWRDRLRWPAALGHLDAETPIGAGRTAVRPDPASDAHIEGLNAIWTDPKVADWLGGVRSADFSQAHLASMADDWARYGWGQWLVVDTDGVVAGWGGLHRTVWAGRPLIEVGWSVRADRQGRGIATDLARAALDVGLGRLGFDEIEAITLPDNAPSWAVMMKVGMEPAGEIAYMGWPHRRAVAAS